MATANAVQRHPDDPVPLDEVLDMLRNIAKDYTSIGSIFTYGARTTSTSRTAPARVDPGRYVKIEQYEALQQEVAALKDTANLLQKENKMRANQAHQTQQSQTAPPRFDNRQTQQVRIQPRPNREGCYYCNGGGHMA